MYFKGIKYKAQILKQGLMLVLVPFSVICIVLILLTQLCIKQEKLATAEQNQSQLMSKFVLTFNDWGETSAYLLGRAFSEENDYEEGSKMLVEKFRQEFAEFRQSGSMPEGVPVLEKLCMSAIYELQSLPRASSSGALANFESLQKMPMIFDRLYSLPNKIKIVLDREWKKLRNAREKEDKQAETMRFFAWGCLAANILLSIVLIWYFAKGITSRLRVLTLNAGLLPKLEKSKLKISGNDELAYLSAVLDDASDKLIAAAEHRRAIFGMVAHDMRSPLNAGQLSLEVVLESLENKLGKEESEQITDELKLAHGKMIDILKHVNSLLSVESALNKEDASEQVNEEQEEQEKQSDQSEQAEPEGVSTDQANLPVEQTKASTDTTLANPKLQFPSLQDVPLWMKPFRFMQEMFLSPRIIHKVLWLVLIPLLTQSAFLLVLNQQFKANNKLIVQERKRSDLTMQINMIFLDSLKSTVSEAIYIVTSDQEIKKLAVKNFDAVIRQFPEMDEFASENGEEWKKIMKSWRKMLKTHLEQAGIIEATRNTALSSNVRESIAKFKPLQKRATKLRNSATKLFKKESASIAQLHEDQHESRQRLTELLMYALGINFVVALAMLIAFGKDIMSRLLIVVENASKLGSPGSVLSPIPGKDEFAFLDSIILHTQQQLQNAANDRAEMMRVIAEEMQGPLKEAQVALLNFQKTQQEQLNEKMSKQLNRAIHNIDRVLFLINDLLTMETLETGKVGLELSQCKLDALVDEAIATVGSLAKQKGIELSNECGELLLEADKSRLIQTVINYLSNAIKFSPNKSKIRISCASKNGLVRVNVIDEGSGMDETTRARVFERFFQAETSEKKQGFGLGLAICTLIVESHGGTLGVESELGKGSCFWFEVPQVAKKGPQTETCNIPMR